MSATTSSLATLAVLLCFLANGAQSVSIPIPTLYAEARVTSSASVKTISYGGGELILRVQTTTDNTITCTKKTNGTVADPTHKRSIGAFFVIELDTEEKVQMGEIQYTYDPATVAAVRTDPSHSTYTCKQAHTRTHTFSISLSVSFSLFLSLSLSCTHTNIYIRAQSSWCVQCTLPQFLCMQISVCRAHIHTCTPSLLGAYIVTESSATLNRAVSSSSLSSSLSLPPCLLVSLRLVPARRRCASCTKTMKAFGQRPTAAQLSTKAPRSLLPPPRTLASGECLVMCSSLASTSPPILIMRHLNWRMERSSSSKAPRTLR